MWLTCVKREPLVPERLQWCTDVRMLVRWACSTRPKKNPDQKRGCHLIDKSHNSTKKPRRNAFPAVIDVAYTISTSCPLTHFAINPERSRMLRWKGVLDWPHIEYNPPREDHLLDFEEDKTSILYRNSYSKRQNWKSKPKKQLAGNCRDYPCLTRV